MRVMSEDANKPDFVMNPGEKTTMLFTQLVFQLSGLATMVLGKAPHPETGKSMRDLEAAQMVIDQLDMLEVKTKGNLSKEEEKLLRQTLMSLRLAYVDAVNAPEASQESTGTNADSTEPTQSSADAQTLKEDSKKKFTKKY